MSAIVERTWHERKRRVAAFNDWRENGHSFRSMFLLNFVWGRPPYRGVYITVALLGFGVCLEWMDWRDEA